jgi:hypothetical protein
VAEILFDAHLSELKQNFPETPGSIMLRADVLREGLRFTRDRAEIGKRAMPSQAFLSREDVPDAEFQGVFLTVPNQLVLGDDTRINNELDRNSPYTVQRDIEELRGGSRSRRSGLTRRPIVIWKPTSSYCATRSFRSSAFSPRLEGRSRRMRSSHPPISSCTWAGSARG